MAKNYIQLPDPKPIAVEDLYLDPQNPRITDENFSVSDQDLILKELWKEKAVNELVDSIAANGFWNHEVLFAVKEKGKLIVVEGNRRLAAVKLLKETELAKKINAIGVPRLTKSDKDRLDRLPVIICKREEIWQYLGFKHVNGPQDWDSIAKAEYVARVHNEFGIPLTEIAQTIGDKHQTVSKLYEGLMVLKQAEAQTSFDRNNRWNKRFAYSHLWTSLGYQPIRKFLGLTSSKYNKPNPVPKAKLRELNDLCLWLYGDKTREKEPLIRSQNPDLRILVEVIDNKNGVAALRSGMFLSSAFKVSQGDDRLLREALISAEQVLKEMKGLVVNGYNGETDLLDRAENIADLARSVFKDMSEIYSDKKNVQGKQIRKTR